MLFQQSQNEPIHKR